MQLNLFGGLKVATLAFGVSVVATASSAAIYTYDLFDNPDGALTKSTSYDYHYGLRLDGSRTDATVNDAGEDYFLLSFSNMNATLAYDDVAGTAEISGTMVQSYADGTFGDEWSVSYMLTNLTNVGLGLFIDTVGTGTGSVTRLDDGVTVSLGNKGRPDGSGGYEYFLFTDASSRTPSGAEAGTIVGEGWVGGSGTQDFLFIAELDDGGVGGEVPLPAAGWLMIAGMGGLAALRRRKR